LRDLVSNTSLHSTKLSIGSSFVYQHETQLATLSTSLALQAQVPLPLPTFSHSPQSTLPPNTPPQKQEGTTTLPLKGRRSLRLARNIPQSLLSQLTPVPRHLRLPLQPLPIVQRLSLLRFSLVNDLPQFLCFVFQFVELGAIDQWFCLLASFDGFR